MRLMLNLAPQTWRQHRKGRAELPQKPQQIPEEGADPCAEAERWQVRPKLYHPDARVHRQILQRYLNLLKPSPNSPHDPGSQHHPSSVPMERQGG